MGIKTYSPYTPSRRHMTGSDFKEITASKPEKSLVVSLKKNSGRNNQGKITVRHQGGGYRTKYRLVDFKRNTLFGASRGVVSQRLHGLILSSVAGALAFSLDYDEHDPKLSAFARKASYPSLPTDAKEWEILALLRAFLA